ncbi:MAG: 2,3-diphosphoglycerate-dependent phosphoglycerate mutase [Candidatus Taylorbacteria bacterium]
MYKLILLRHGESVWNKENRFTGWTDVDLSEKGVIEAHKAGMTLKQQGYSFDLAFQNPLMRVTKTLKIVLEELNESNIEIRTAWQLNERHYGALQGLNKAETSEKYGEEQVKIWRRGYDVLIPSITKDSPMYPGKNPLYADLKETEIPLSENLKDVVARVVPYWSQNIVPEIKNGRKVIVAASGNSLRALVKHIENISDQDITELNIPTAIPLVYEFDADMKFVSKSFVGDPDEVKRAVDMVANQAKSKK